MFPTNSQGIRVGMDTAGDFSGGAYNAEGTEIIQWADLFNSLFTTLPDSSTPAINVICTGLTLEDFCVSGVTPVNGTIPITIIAPTAKVDGAITEADLLAHKFAGSSTPCGARIRVVADASNNAAGVLIGNTSTPHFPLYAGNYVDLACSDLTNLYYQFQHSGDKIYYITTA